MTITEEEIEKMAEESLTRFSIAIPFPTSTENMQIAMHRWLKERWIAGFRKAQELCKENPAPILKDVNIIFNTMRDSRHSFYVGNPVVQDTHKELQRVLKIETK